MAGKAIAEVVMMTTREAKEKHKQIQEAYVEMGRSLGVLLLEMRERRGFEALDYKTFEDYIKTEFDESRSTVYRLMNVATVEQNVGKPVSVRQAALLAQLPDEEQKEALKESGGDAKALSKTVAKRTKSKPRPRSADTEWTVDEMKKDQELLEAFQAIALVYGNDDTKAIRTGVIGFKRADVLQLSKLPQDKMREIHDLIMANHWTPKEALTFASRMPDEDTTIAELKNYALLTKGNFFTGNFDGFTVTCKADRAPKR